MYFLNPIMNKMYKIFKVLLFSALVFAWGCQTDKFKEVSKQPSQPGFTIQQITGNIPAARLSGESLCGDPVVNPLYGLNQKGHIGFLSIGNSEDSLFVNFDLDTGWFIHTIYLYTGPEEQLPVTRWGFPKVGEFPFIKFPRKEVNDYTVSVPLSGDDSVTVAAYVIVYKWEKFNKHRSMKMQGLWGKGHKQIGKIWGWGWTINYGVQSCDEDGGNGGGGNPSPCLQAWNDGQFSYTISASQLGWYNTYTSSTSPYTKIFYANSGANPVTSGSAVGEIYVDYFGVVGTYYLTVTYKITDPAYSLTEMHLYVGDGAPATIPEGFPYSKSGIKTTIDQFTFTVNYSSPNPPVLTIAAEGVVCPN